MSNAGLPRRINSCGLAGLADNDVRALPGKGFLERTDIIASGDTVLEGHGVDHLAWREHVGLQRGEGRFEEIPVGFSHAAQ